MSCTQIKVKKSGVTFERLLRKLPEKARRSRDQRDLPQDSAVIIIIDWVASYSQKALHFIKGPLQCKNHAEQYIHFGRKRPLHISNPPHQLTHPSMRRFVKW